MKGILVIGHGSRSQEADEVFFKIVDMLKNKTGSLVEGCYMEISKPSIPETIEKMYKEGIKDFTVLPYFLFPGIHIKEDIPEILKEVEEKYEDIKISMANPIGYNELLVDILLERVNGEKQCI
ncbi:cobalamin biosynthesis protein CbiX [Clostridium polyendosporum]|uniref:Cobalamin biosynthesis protein CbiX n=1 Tax=Clostridium polyendosporum TaxID=69208 RepID=A0A919RXP0_9CLOT|nr:CbiX/SirB N-terminal domain-containing protein [Clostridium polyendosporum]GIM28192.1 cobalamin biosynthesis protein CbiX [Clostridium polyendosporum]